MSKKVNLKRSDQTMLMKISKKQIKQVCKKLGEDLVDFSFLASGNHNDNYLIKTTTGRYVLRIENNPQFKNLKKEYNLLKSLKPDLGPKVYFFDKSHKIIATDYFIEKFVEGGYPKRLDNRFIILMAQWIKRLHTQKKICKKHSLLKAIKPYFNNIDKYKTALSVEMVSEINQLFDIVYVFCEKNDGLFGSRKRASLLHSDLSKENIAYDGKRVRLLDWEFSNYNFPEWDLVYFMQSSKLSDKQRSLFLKTYGYPTSKSGKKRLLVVSLLNTCGDIGYSTWRLGLIKQGKLKKIEKTKTLRRLKQDIQLLEKIIGNLEK